MRLPAVIAALWIAAPTAFAQRIAVSPVVEAPLGAAPAAGAAGAAPGTFLGLPPSLPASVLSAQGTAMARSLSATYARGNEDYAAWLADIALRPERTRRTLMAEAEPGDHGLRIAQAVLHRSQPGFDEPEYARLLRRVEPDYRGIAVSAGVIVGEYAAKLARHLGPATASFADASIDEVDPTGFFRERVGKEPFEKDHRAAKSAGVEDAVLPDLWSVMRTMTDAQRRNFIDHRSRYEAYRLRKDWGDFSGHFEGAFDSLLSARTLAPSGPAEYVNSGEFGVVFRVPTDRGPVAVKVLRRFAFDRYELDFDSAGDEPRLIREIGRSFDDPSLAPRQTKPRNVRVLGLIASGTMDLRALGLAAGSKPVFAPVLWLPFAIGETLEAFLDRGEPIAAADWEDFKRGVARLHALGYAHDDLRTRNIQIARDPKTGRSAFTILDSGAMRLRAEDVGRFRKARESDLEDLRQTESRLKNRGLLAP